MICVGANASHCQRSVFAFFAFGGYVARVPGSVPCVLNPARGLQWGHEGNDGVLPIKWRVVGSGESGKGSGSRVRNRV